MSDKPDSEEVVPEPDASQASVNSGGQPASETQAGNLGDNDAADQVSNLSEKQIREIVRRESQSIKDSRVAKIESAQQETASRLDQYEAYRASGMEPAQAKRELAVDVLLAAQDAQPVREQVNSGLTAQDALSLASSALKGVSENIREAVIAELDTRAFASVEVLNQFIVNQSLAHATKPVGTTAITSTPNAGDAVKHGIEEKTADFITKYTTALQENRAGDAKILKREARTAGIPVDQIRWDID